MHRLIFARICIAGIGAAVAGVSAPAMAQHAQTVPGARPAGPDTRPEWHGDHRAPAAPAIADHAREDWLIECRRRIAPRDNGVRGALIGGVLGGFAGNRIAGRGNRTIGTVAGAAVGAVAGAAIDRAEDRGRERDACETYLDNYTAYYSQVGYGYAYAGYGQLQPANCCRPVAMAPVQSRAPECTETVEYIDEDVHVRPKARSIPRRPTKTIRDKRIRVD